MDTVLCRKVKIQYILSLTKEIQMNFIEFKFLYLRGLTEFFYMLFLKQFNATGQDIQWITVSVHDCVRADFYLAFIYFS